MPYTPSSLWLALDRYSVNNMYSRDTAPYTVLIVDDSEDDRFFIRTILGRFPRFKIIGEVCDGEEAIAYISGRQEFADREKYPLPDLMLLDIKMPRKTGFEVLQWMSAQSLPNLTVIVLSSSSLAQDIGASLALGAHGFWTKTAEVEKQNMIVQEIKVILDNRGSCALAKT